MPKLLEVIVTSLEEALEAEAGGADRLELVRALDLGGLTPPIETVKAITEAVRIPVRVMLRENPTLWLSSAQEVQTLRMHAKFFSELKIAGFVLGFVREERIDTGALRTILADIRPLPVTFHRAFDEVADPLAAIEQLKEIAQLDRILTSGGDGEWEQRRGRLLAWQAAASPAIELLVGAGVCDSALSELRDCPPLREVHVGRAARNPRTVEGSVDRIAVQKVKNALA
jgi:copper homeostasis protein